MSRRIPSCRRLLCAALLFPGLAAAHGPKLPPGPSSAEIQLSDASRAGRGVVYTMKLALEAAQAPGQQLLTLRGRLMERGSPASGVYDLELTVHGDPDGQTPLLAPFEEPGLIIEDGLFTTQLDLHGLGPVDSALYLEARLKPSVGKRPWKTLRPRAAVRLPTQNGEGGASAGAPVLSGAGSHWGETWSGPGLGLQLFAEDGAAIVAYTPSTAEDDYGTSALMGIAWEYNGEAVGVIGWGWSHRGAGIMGQNWATTGDAWGAAGVTHSHDGIGVYGSATTEASGLPAPYNGTGEGVRGESAWLQGRGVTGEALATTGINYGVYGSSLSPDGTGVYGRATTTTGYNTGVRGQSDSTAGTGVYAVASAATGATYGVSSVSSSTAGTGILAQATAATGITRGVWGASQSTSGYGVYGSVSAPTGATYGVYGYSNSSSGNGVYGRTIAPSGTTTGVTGESNSTSGRGVYGYASTATGATSGVYGLSQSSGGKGVFAQNTSSGVGLYARSSSGNPIEAYGAGAIDREFYVSNTGEVYADGTFHSGGADFAELLPASEGLEPGDVLAIGLDGKLTRSTSAYQTSVLGIYSTQPGFLGGSGDESAAKGKVPLAVVGLVPVKVSTENGPIHPGDLLVAASTPGHAMAAGKEPPRGSVLGKALAGIETGSGVIRMFVLPQ